MESLSRRLPGGPLAFGLVAALAGSALTLVSLVATRQLALPTKPTPQVAPPAAKAPAPIPTEAVAALGRLDPAGDIRVLATPPGGGLVAPPAGGLGQ